MHSLSNELNNKFIEIANSLGFDTPGSAIRWFKEKLISLDLKSPISSNYENDIKTLVDSVNPERLSNNPIQFDKKELEEMYKEIIQK